MFVDLCLWIAVCYFLPGLPSLSEYIDPNVRGETADFFTKEIVEEIFKDSPLNTYLRNVSIDIFESFKLLRVLFFNASVGFLQHRFVSF